MTTIREEDFIQSVADGFQFISYYHPVDYIKALAEAYRREESPAAKDAMAQILINSRMSAEGHRPMCQDTGIAIAFVKVGMDVRWDTKRRWQELVNEGVRRAYTDKDNPLRASVLADPDGKRKSTGDNTPAVTHVELVPGDKVEVIVAAKGGGSENKSQVRDAAAQRLDRRLGALGGADHGRGLVPARDALAGHRRHAGEGHADGQVGNDGPDQFP